MYIYIYIVINWISKNWCTPFICSYLIKIKITSQNVYFTFNLSFH